MAIAAVLASASPLLAAEVPKAESAEAPRVASAWTVEIETADTTIRPTATPGASPPGGLTTPGRPKSLDLSDVAIEPGASGRPGATLSAGDRKVALEDVLFLRFAGVALGEAPSVLFLHGGTGGAPAAGAGAELHGKVVGGDADSIEFLAASLGGDPVRVDLEAVHGLIILPSGRSASGPDPASAGEAAATREERNRESALATALRHEILTRRSEVDEVVLLEGGRVRGVLSAVGPDGIRISAETLGDVTISFARIRALHLAELGPEDGAPEGPRGDGAEAATGVKAARLSLRDGSDLPCEILTLGGGMVRLRHPALGEREVTLTEVLEVAFLDGHARFLSDLEPVATEERVGDLQIKKPFQRDSSVEGTPLRMGGKPYRKGLGVHSYSRLEYSLDGGFSRFRASLGLDETAAPGPEVPDPDAVGIVVFRVRLDGKTLLEKKMTWRDDPAAVDLVVAGGNRLTLEVTYPEEGTWEDPTLGRANWAGAILVR